MAFPPFAEFRFLNLLRPQLPAPSRSLGLRLSKWQASLRHGRPRCGTPAHSAPSTLSSDRRHCCGIDGGRKCRRQNGKKSHCISWRLIISVRLVTSFCLSSLCFLDRRCSRRTPLILLSSRMARRPRLLQDRARRLGIGERCRRGSRPIAPRTPRNSRAEKILPDTFGRDGCEVSDFLAGLDKCSDLIGEVSSNHRTTHLC
jgi:hypothetical protein